jgi:hypothetical protein
MSEEESLYSEPQETPSQVHTTPYQMDLELSDAHWQMILTRTNPTNHHHTLVQEFQYLTNQINEADRPENYFQVINELVNELLMTADVD